MGKIAVFFLCLLPSVAWAQAPGSAGGVGPPLTNIVRMEGYLSPETGRKDVLGTVTIGIHRSTHTFALTAVQSLTRAEEGLAVFRHVRSRPVNLRLRGAAEMLRRITQADPQRKIIIFGLLRSGPGTLDVLQVD